MAIYLRHFNSHHKLLAGYLDGTNVQTVAASGEYTLRALEAPDANGVFQLRIPLYGDTFYFLEYRSRKLWRAHVSMRDALSPVPALESSRGLYAARRHSYR